MRRRTRRSALLALVAQLLLPLAGVASAQSATGAGTTGGDHAVRHIPFGLGESLIYAVNYGPARVGTARMEVHGLDTLRGRTAWHLSLRIEGGIPGFRVRYLMESWVDTLTFESLRFVSESAERSRRRKDEYEIFPERGTYLRVQHKYDAERKAWSEIRHPETAAQPQPLDQAAFLFFVRTQPLDAGASLSFARYFEPERNPVRVNVLRRERTDVPVGSFPTIVVQPIFKSRGLFSENGRAALWLTDDDARLLVRLQTWLAFGSVTLQLEELVRGYRP